MSHHLEIEEKHDVDDTTPLPPLDGLPGVAAVEPSGEHELSATYVDTSDLTLAAARITLRRRTGGHDEGWHLKLPHGSGRLEVHAPLGRSATTVPKRLRDAVAGWTRGEQLRPVVTLTTHRATYGLLDKKGGCLPRWPTTG